MILPVPVEPLRTDWPAGVVHAVVLDDLESAFFTQDQLTLLRNFVSYRGGGFLMLGGPDAFADGKYDGFEFGAGAVSFDNTLLLIEPGAAKQYAIEQKKLIVVLPPEAGDEAGQAGELDGGGRLQERSSARRWCLRRLLLQGRTRRKIARPCASRSTRRRRPIAASRCTNRTASRAISPISTGRRIRLPAHAALRSLGRGSFRISAKRR